MSDNKLNIIVTVGSVAAISAFVGTFVWFVLSQRQLSDVEEHKEITFGGTCANSSNVVTKYRESCKSSFGVNYDSNIGGCDTPLCNDATSSMRVVSSADISSKCSRLTEVGAPKVSVGKMNQLQCVALDGEIAGDGNCYVFACNCTADEALATVMPLGHCPSDRNVSRTAEFTNVENVACRSLGGAPAPNRTCFLSLCSRK